MQTLQPKLPAISAPVLALRGTGDRIVPEGGMRDFLDKVPSSVPFAYAQPISDTHTRYDCPQVRCRR